jgi:hypothetical protein
MILRHRLGRRTSACGLTRPRSSISARAPRRRAGTRSRARSPGREPEPADSLALRGRR